MSLAMELKGLELDLQWPEEVSIRELRPWILNQLGQHGAPLRWAITSIQSSQSGNLTRQLRIEAVVIVM